MLSSSVTICHLLSCWAAYPIRGKGLSCYNGNKYGRDRLARMGAGENMSDDMMDNLIQLPEFVELKNDVEKLQIELSMLILERDELRYIEAENIKNSYMLQLGSLEYKVFEASCACRRLKRKMALLQVKINRQETIDMSEIENILDREFAVYQKMLDEKMEAVNRAIEYEHADVMTEADVKQLKKMYRMVIKALHPDVNTDITEAEKRLFLHAVFAYKKGDLKTLKLISEMISEPVLPKAGSDAMLALSREKKRLLALLQDIEVDMARIRSSYPFTLLPILENDALCHAREAELKEKLCSFQDAIDYYRSKINDMVR